jgi:hypothetical protein
VLRLIALLVWSDRRYAHPATCAGVGLADIHEFTQDFLGVFGYVTVVVAAARAWFTGTKTREQA